MTEPTQPIKLIDKELNTESILALQAHESQATLASENESIELDLLHLHVSESMASQSEMKESSEDGRSVSPEKLKDLENLVLKLDSAITTSSQVPQRLAVQLYAAVGEINGNQSPKSVTKRSTLEVSSGLHKRSGVRSASPSKIPTPKPKVSGSKAVANVEDTRLRLPSNIDQQIKLREEQRLKKSIEEEETEAKRAREYEAECERQRKKIEQEERQRKLKERKALELMKKREKDVEREELLQNHKAALELKQQELKLEKERKRAEVREVAQKRREDKEAKIARIREESARQKAELQERLEEARKVQEQQRKEVLLQQEEARKLAALRRQEKLDLEKLERERQLKERAQIEEDRRREMQWREEQAKLAKEQRGCAALARKSFGDK